MRKKVDDRNLEFIPQDMFDKLSKEEQKLILKHRDNLRLVRLKQKRINTLNERLNEQKELLQHLKESLTESDGKVNHLRSNYKFSCSFIVQKPRSSGKQYCNISVSRSGRNPHSISCGNKDTLKQHLLEYFKGDKKHLRRIKYDHVNWMKVECKTPTTQGEERVVYNTIRTWIFNNPLGFDNETHNYMDLFPLDKKKGK